MYKKILVQFLLFVIVLSIILSIFFIYFNKENNINEKGIESSKVLKSEIDDKTGTLIKDLNYSFSDASGNSYELFSELGEVDIKNSNNMFMTNVEALIYLKNSPPIKIVSKYANYNKMDHETNFFEDVVLTHLIHKATSDNLDISFSNNTATMYNNIIYNKPETQITADRLEIDLITKNTKIFMDNEPEKIKIINKN